MTLNAKTRPEEEIKRCSWCLSHPLYIAYHDEEWGVESHDENRLFEMLILEGAQAGLSWLTILKRREAYRIAYRGWDIQKIAHYGNTDIKRLMNDKSIIRNRSKINASIKNAKCFIDIQKEFKAFDFYLWRFTNGKTLRPKKRPRTMAEIPSESTESRALSKDLYARGFRFVGPVICYSFMQACGMVDDHMEGCFKSTP